MQDSRNQQAGLWSFVITEADSLYKWAKCGEDAFSIVPTILWAFGSAALAQRLLAALFRRFLFRRIPMWEIMLQHLLFLWILIYSLQFWSLIVRVLKVVVDYVFLEHINSINNSWTIKLLNHLSMPPNQPNEYIKIKFQSMLSNPQSFNKIPSLQSEINNFTKEMVEQWVIWMCGATPLAVYFQTRPRASPPPLMIWITTSPWHRREMGPYGYYLNRPLSSLHSQTNLSINQQVYILRRAYSDSKIIIKEPVKKKRYSKSV